MKKFIAVLLASCILLSLAACGSDGKKSSEGSASSDSSKNISASATDTDETGGSNLVRKAGGDEGWWEPYEEPVTITIVNRLRTDLALPDGQDWEDNNWIRAYKELFNIDVVTEWISDDYDTKLNLAISSQSLPDMFVANSSQFRQLKENGMLADLTEVYDETASQGLKELMEGDPSVFDTAKTDGKLFGMPTLHYGYLSLVNYIWLRHDWMEEDGYSSPGTIKELEEILQGFKQEHDAYGLAVDRTLEHLMLLAPSFGAYHNIWLEADDESIAYSSIQPEMKTALETFARWYQEGLLSQEFAQKDWDTMLEDLITGKTGAWPFYQWAGYAIGTDSVNNNGSEGYLAPYALPGEDVVNPVGFPNGGYSVVNKNCEHPEALIKLLNHRYYMFKEAVPNGDYTVEEVEQFPDHITGPFYFMNPNDELIQYETIQEALASDGSYEFDDYVTELKYNNIKSWFDDQNPDGIGYALQMGSPESAYGIGKEDVAADNFLRSRLWGETPAYLSETGSTLSDLLIEGFTKIIIGAEPVDYFDTLVENWKKAGGDEATRVMNETYG